MTKERLIELWEEHVADEFSIKDAQATIDTMCEDAYVNHVPTLAGGYGREELLAFYSKDFIPVMPPDTSITPVSRTVGENQLVDEMIFSFTHSQPIPWMLPGVSADLSEGAHSPGGDGRLSRRQACARAHLLGPSFCVEADRPFERPGTSRLWGRNGRKSSRSQAADRSYSAGEGRVSIVMWPNSSQWQAHVYGNER